MNNVIDFMTREPMSEELLAEAASFQIGVEGLLALQDAGFDGSRLLLVSYDQNAGAGFVSLGLSAVEVVAALKDALKKAEANMVASA